MSPEKVQVRTFAGGQRRPWRKVHAGRPCPRPAPTWPRVSLLWLPCPVAPSCPRRACTWGAGPSEESWGRQSPLKAGIGGSQRWPVASADRSPGFRGSTEWPGRAGWPWDQLCGRAVGGPVCGSVPGVPVRPEASRKAAGRLTGVARDPARGGRGLACLGGQPCVLRPWPRPGPRGLRAEEPGPPFRACPPPPQPPGMWAGLPARSCRPERGARQRAERCSAPELGKSVSRHVGGLLDGAWRFFLHKGRRSAPGGRALGIRGALLPSSGIGSRHWAAVAAAAAAARALPCPWAGRSGSRGAVGKDRTRDGARRALGALGRRQGAPQIPASARGRRRVARGKHTLRVQLAAMPGRAVGLCPPSPGVAGCPRLGDVSAGPLPLLPLPLGALTRPVEAVALPCPCRVAPPPPPREHHPERLSWMPALSKPPPEDHSLAGRRCRGLPGSGGEGPEMCLPSKG